MSAPGAEVELVATPGAAEEQAILDALIAYNDAAAGPGGHEPLAVVVRNPAGTVIGGLWGTTSYGWLFVRYPVLPDTMRGQGTGTRLMASAEAEARRRGCLGMWLDTFSFQAEGFYHRLRFATFGTIADYPPGEARHFLVKRFD